MYRRINMQYRRKPSRFRVSPLALALLALALVGTGFPSSTHALTAAQCAFFEQDDTVELCHATASAKHPYVPIIVSVDACVEGHAEQHPADFIAVNDPQCEGEGCLPAEAPCDATVLCCEGLQCVNERCIIPIPET